MMPCHGSDSGREQSRHDLRGLWMFHEHLDGVEKRFSFFFFFNRCTNWNSLQGETIQSRKYR